MYGGFVEESPGMGLNKDLQGLIERACNLHDRLNKEINDSVRFCNSCSEHGWLCKITETPFEEREILIACRDSLKELEDLLIYVQRLRSWQLINRQAALNQLEESRLTLIEKVSQYEGRPLNVIEELNACFGHGKTAFDWDLKIKSNVQNEKKQTKNFFLCCIRFICSPGRWQKAVATAAKLIVISSTVHFYRTRQQFCSSNGNMTAHVDSIQAGKAETMLTISKNHLNVLNGRG